MSDLKTKKPPKAKLEKAVGAHVDFQVEHTSELLRLWPGGVILVKVVWEGCKTWSSCRSSIERRPMKKWISAGDADKFKAALLDAVVTKVSKNKKPKSKRKDSLGRVKR